MTTVARGRRPPKKARQPPSAARSRRALRFEDISSRGALEIVEAVKHGLPVQFMDDLRAETNLPASLLQDVTSISESTLARRRRATGAARAKARPLPAAARLSQQQSERIVRVALLWRRTLDLFQGDRDLARRWLQNPNPALGGKAPLAVADTELGAREVEAVLDRFDEGVY